MDTSYLLVLPCIRQSLHTYLGSYAVERSIGQLSLIMPSSTVQDVNIEMVFLLLYPCTTIGQLPVVFMGPANARLLRWVLGSFLHRAPCPDVTIKHCRCQKKARVTSATLAMPPLYQVSQDSYCSTTHHRRGIRECPDRMSSSSNLVHNMIIMNIFQMSRPPGPSHTHSLFVFLVILLIKPPCPLFPRLTNSIGRLREMQSTLSIHVHLVDDCTGLPALTSRIYSPGFRARPYLILHFLPEA